MRNRTAIRLLLLLAVFAAAVPPLVMLGYARRLGEAHVSRQLEELSEGAVARSESIVDGVLTSINELFTTSAPDSDLLRRAVFRNPFLKAIVVQSPGEIASSTGEIDPWQLAPHALPPIGEFRLEGAVSAGLPVPAIALVHRRSEDVIVVALMHPDAFVDSAHGRAAEANARTFVFFGKGEPALAFGASGIELPPEPASGPIAATATSDRRPIRAIAVAGVGSVEAEWARSAPRFALAGGLISLLLCALVLRSARRLSTLEAELREAIKFDEISVYYQPVVDLETNRCLGAEALMRWRHPERGMQRAGEFIDVAEKTRLIVPMTDRVIDRVAADFESLLQNDPDLHVAINLASQHFSDTRILGTVRSAFNGHAKNVIFEITERSLVAGSDSVARTVMDGLTECGAKLAVDDFGTGYSNLSYLQRFPVDFLKIDKSFVDEIKASDASAALVDQVIRIGRMLNMEIIAEGVEHANQAAYLRKEGVRMAQGWFFGEPMPIDEFRQFVALHNSGAASLS